MQTASEDVDRLFGQGISPAARLLWLGGILEQDHGADETMGEEPGIYWNTARRVIKGLSILDIEPSQPITIVMNSCGGDWDHGMAIYDAIRSCRSRIIMINMSHARSMTSVIFQAADYRITAPHSYYMIHDGYEAVSDIPKSVQTTTAFNREHVTPAMYRIYLSRLNETSPEGEPLTDASNVAAILNSKLPSGASKVRPSRGVTLDHIAQLCGQDTYFTPDEMIVCNFADRLLRPGDLSGAVANPDMLETA